MADMKQPDGRLHVLNQKEIDLIPYIPTLLSTSHIYSIFPSMFCPGLATAPAGDQHITQRG